MPAFRVDDPLTKGFLEGTHFGESIAFEYEFETPLQDRMTFLCNLAQGKRIIHIGCCDHTSVIQEKISTGNWLHGKLTKVAAHCIGVDIDPDGVSQARSTSGLSNILLGDITGRPGIADIERETFDYAIFADVIEHVGNPVHFLTSFLSMYKINIQNVVITVPNSLWFRNIQNVIRTREVINSDHRFCFTPYALVKVAWDAGLEPVSLHIVNYTTPNLFKRSILNRFPLLAGGIAYIGAPRNQKPDS